MTDGQLNLPGLRFVAGSDHDEHTEPRKVEPQPASPGEFVIPKTPSQNLRDGGQAARHGAQDSIAVQNAQRGIGDGFDEGAAGRPPAQRDAPELEF